MDSNLNNPQELHPDLPTITRIEELKVEPWEDKSRLTIKVLLSPFQQRPSVRLLISTVQGEKIVETTIIETTDSAFELTMHLPKQIEAKQFLLQGIIIYENEETGDQMTIPFEV